MAGRGAAVPRSDVKRREFPARRVPPWIATAGRCGVSAIFGRAWALSPLPRVCAEVMAAASGGRRANGRRRVGTALTEHRGRLAGLLSEGRAVRAPSGCRSRVSGPAEGPIPAARSLRNRDSQWPGGRTAEAEQGGDRFSCKCAVFVQFAGL